MVATSTTALRHHAVEPGHQAHRRRRRPPPHRRRRRSGQADFLKLMTAQMKNQDPFDPVDNTQMVAQMAQFSLARRDQRDGRDAEGRSPTSSARRSVADASSYIGKTVLTAGDTAYGRTGGGIAGAVELAGPASDVKVTIEGQDGQVLDQLSLGAQAAGTVSLRLGRQDRRRRGCRHGPVHRHRHRAEQGRGGRRHRAGLGARPVRLRARHGLPHPQRRRPRHRRHHRRPPDRLNSSFASGVTPMSFYTSLSGLQASQTEMSTISHNLANVSTNGFKKSRTEFADIIASSRLAVADADGRLGHGREGQPPAVRPGQPDPVVEQPRSRDLGRRLLRGEARAGLVQGQLHPQRRLPGRQRPLRRRFAAAATCRSIRSTGRARSSRPGSTSAIVAAAAADQRHRRCRPTPRR